MPDQRQPDQPIDRNTDRNQQADRQNQQGLQGSQSERQGQQNFQDSQSDRQNQQNLQGSQSDRQDQQNLQGNQSSRQNQQNPQGNQSERQNQGLQGSSGMSGGSSRSGRDQETGLDMSRRENTSQSGGMQQDQWQTREGQQSDRGVGEDLNRRQTSYTDQERSRPYDSDDMEAMGTSEIDEQGFGDSRTRLQDDQRRRNEIDR